MPKTELSPLGKAAEYSENYNPSLLFPIPRSEKRHEIGLAELLPFHGIDIWNSYELSWITPSGKPAVATAEFHIPATSPNLIESKSFKLYLNSFNQTTVGSTEKLITTLQRDLSEAAKTDITVNIQLASQWQPDPLSVLSGSCLDNLEIEINRYSVASDLLTADSTQVTEETLYSNLLKSNCLVTGQPDWGSVLIRYAGPKIDHAALLKYIISYRQHQGFHEQCIEKIFVDILKQCSPEKLTVYARYTRRGGLDINPFRSNFENAPPNGRLHRQ